MERRQVHQRLEEKKRTLIVHLLQHGHYGPFEHPPATFAIEGMSRACMAQLTRHRHVSFDVQSMRYVAFDAVDPADVKAGAIVVTPPPRRMRIGLDAIKKKEQSVRR